MGMSDRRSPSHNVVVAALVAFVATSALLVGPLPASAAPGSGATGSAGSAVAQTTTTTTTTKSGSSGSSSRSSARRAADDDVDALTATREEVNQKIARLDAQYAEQQAAVDAANAAVDVANQEVERARARVALAQNEVELARQIVRDYAVEAYITPPAQDSLRVLSLSRAEDASYANDVMKILAEERRKVVDVLVAKQGVADREAATADAAADAAAQQSEAARAQLADLDGIRVEQEQLAETLDDRLDRALAESAALAEIDRQMAAELAAQELALRQAAVPTTPKVQPVSAAPSSTTTAPPAGGGGSGGGSGPAPTSPPTTRPPTTSPPATSPPPSSGIVTWADVTSVGGIYVHRSIAGQLASLLDAAAAAGFSLRGGGYRDSAAQIATRQANCGSTYYDIYQKPASQCTPPTAIPGRSMHEQGRAIDFTSGGVLISSRSNPAFVWLSQNAARFGFYNLPSEPWHWSTNGN